MYGIRTGGKANLATKPRARRPQKSVWTHAQGRRVRSRGRTQARGRGPPVLLTPCRVTTRPASPGPRTVLSVLMLHEVLGRPQRRQSARPHGTQLHRTSSHAGSDSKRSEPRHRLPDCKSDQSWPRSWALGRRERAEVDKSNLLTGRERGGHDGPRGISDELRSVGKMSHVLIP